MAGLFGYTHPTGGYPGGQAEYLRVPFADTTHIKVPEGIPDEKLLFLSDIFPTGCQAAVQADILSTDTVAIWGCGPVSQMTIRSAILLGAEQVVAIDRLPERLEIAEAGGALTINFEKESVFERLNELTGGEGPQKCIDCVGVESHVSFSAPDTVLDRTKQMVGLETDRPACLPADGLRLPSRRRAVDPRRLSRIRPQNSMGMLMNKGLTVRTGRCGGSRRSRSTLPSSSPTKRTLRRGPRCTGVFRDKQDGCVKVVLRP